MQARLEGETTGDERVVTCLTFPPGTPAVGVGHGVGSVLSGKYRLDALLGEGAMGAVWQATNLLLDCRVAIKLTHAELTGPGFRERLHFEARAAASLGHPAVVRIFDVGETDVGDPFMVMELLQGGTLAQMLARGPLTALRAVQIVLPVVDALAAMHARGIVHRDVKPDNLFVSLEGERVQPKLLDFGIAKLSDDRGEQHDRDERGTLVGSPEYMSPEQAAACDDVDYRTDIWSTCIVLYEAISGETPFTAANGAPALLRAIWEDEPVSLVERSVGDEPLWDIIRLGLSKDPAARHGSMSELGRALASWLLGHGVTEDVCGTSLEPKWFADASSRPETSVQERARPDVHANTRQEPADDPGRTLPPTRASGGRPRRTGSKVRRNWAVLAAKACTLGAVVAAGVCMPAPRHMSLSLVALSHGETSSRPAVRGLRGGAPHGEPSDVSTVARTGTRQEVSVSPQMRPEVSPVDAPPVPSVNRQKLAGNAVYLGGAHKGLLGSSSAVLRKASDARASGADLDLIAPY